MTTTQLTGAFRAAPRPPRHRGSGRAVVAVVVVLAVAVAGAGVWAWSKGSVANVPIREHCLATVRDATSDLDPEQAGNAAVIASVAVRRGLPARAATIGIATAIQESKLRSIDYGDRDSLGLFQQRPSQGWGTARQVQDPVYASNAFYDVLVKVEGYQNLPITDAAQKVQRSAFPSAYADHEPEARIVASALSGYSPGAFTCVLRPADVAPEAPGDNGLTPRATAVVAAARAETGRPGRADPKAAEADGSAGASAGTAVRFTLTGSDAARLSWSLAHWAVARADGLSIDAVEVDGRQWRRGSPDSGWALVDGAPPAGTVVVHVATGA
jgi:hypothetical protein